MFLPVIMKACKPLKQIIRVLPVFQYTFLVFVPSNLFRKMNVCAKSFIFSFVYGLSVTIGHHLNSLETARAAQMTEDGLSQRQVARTLGVIPSVLTDFGLVIWSLAITAEGQGRVGQGKN